MMDYILILALLGSLVFADSKHQPTKGKLKSSMDDQSKRSQTHFLTNEQETVLNKLDPNSMMKISSILANIEPPRTVSGNTRADTKMNITQSQQPADMKAVLGSKREPNLLSVVQDNAIIREQPFGTQSEMNSFNTMPSGSENGIPSGMPLATERRLEKPPSNLAKLYSTSNQGPSISSFNKNITSGDNRVTSSSDHDNLLSQEFNKFNPDIKPMKLMPLKTGDSNQVKGPIAASQDEQMPNESVLPGVGIMEFKDNGDSATENAAKNKSETINYDHPIEMKPLQPMVRPSIAKQWEAPFQMATAPVAAAAEPAVRPFFPEQEVQPIAPAARPLAPVLNNATLSPGNKRRTQFAFSYDPENLLGPERWKEMHLDWTCQGRRQSPIDIQTDEIITDRVCKNVMIKMEPPDRPIVGVLRNNGHAPTLSIASDISVRLFGAMLPNDYYLKQLHFHFGCDNTKGSEHRIDGEIYPLELHLVFWDNKTFASFAQAAKSDRGIVVLAVLFQRSFVPPAQIRNTPLSQFLQIAKKIEHEGDYMKVPEMFDLRLERLVPNVMNQEQADRFFTYEGSLTTPGCYESVTWIVYDTHPIVTDEQMDAFRRLKSSKVNQLGTMCNNFRPIQRTNGRRIYSNIV